MRGEDAGDADAVALGLLPQGDEVLVRQLVHLKEAAQLGVPDAFFGQQAKQPFVGVAILDRVCFEADVEGQI